MGRPLGSKITDAEFRVLLDLALAHEGQPGLYAVRFWAPISRQAVTGICVTGTCVLMYESAADTAEDATRIHRQWLDSMLRVVDVATAQRQAGIVAEREIARFLIHQQEPGQK